MNPTHRHIETQTLVFPGGYPEEALEVLPEGFWEDWNLEQNLIALRQKRDRLLLESDKYMLLDMPITEEKRNEWIAYRQLLRDLPETGNIENPQWPSKPN